MERRALFHNQKERLRGFADDSDHDDDAEEQPYWLMLAGEAPETAESEPDHVMGYESPEGSSSDESDDDVEQGLFWWPDEKTSSSRSTSLESNPSRPSTPVEPGADRPHDSDVPISNMAISVPIPSKIEQHSPLEEGPIVHLPTELQVHCLSFLKLKNLFVLFDVSKQFRSILAAAVLELDASNWRRRTLIRYGHFCPTIFPYLQRLSIESHPFQQSWESLSRLSSLRTLNLCRTGFADKHASILQNLTGLESLDLRYSLLTGKGLRFLENLTNLQTLLIRQAHFCDDIEALSDSGLRYFRGMKHLKMLQYSQGRRAASSLIPKVMSFRGSGLVHLAELPHLTALNICNSDIEAPEFEYVALLTELRELNIGWCAWILASDIDILLKLPKLELVYCHGTMLCSGPQLAIANEARPQISFETRKWV